MGIAQNRGVPTNPISFYFAGKPQNLTACVSKLWEGGDNFEAQINTGWGTQ